MKNLIFISGFLAIAFLFSCEKQGFFIKCSECLDEEPKTATINLNVDLSTNGVPVQIYIYEGNLEDNVLYKTISLPISEGTTTVALNKKYTITAEYILSGEKYIVVNSVTPRVRYSDDQCENPCYFVYDNDVSLKLRY